MIISLLASDLHLSLAMSRSSSRFQENIWMQLMQEIIRCALSVQPCYRKSRPFMVYQRTLRRTKSIRIWTGSVTFAIRSVASYTSLASSTPPNKYPSNAFFPHDDLVELHTGEKADAERYCFVLERDLR